MALHMKVLRGCDRWAAVVLRSKDEADDIVDLYGGALSLNHPKLFEQGLVHLCKCPACLRLFAWP